ncbi:hypothetical protein NUW58_g3749 [Xylaria curta]|uniref:Uncharacterized protein n=1 Tax=Xylaria curta TaxID=42375 RepID=A0ACC1P9M0_9PEZI|nr:hypothetical protein NUW58_g3749 [Xylaria curta]
MRASMFVPAMLATAFTAFNKTCDVQPSPPKLSYLITVFATETPPIIVGNGGYGTRIFIPITGGSFSGPELQGSVLGVGGDWGNYDATGTVFSPDAKIVLQTDDGAQILISGRGRSPYITFDLETGSENYSWLNSVIGVGSIQVGDNNITVNLFRCSALAALLPSKISFPGSLGYNASLTSYYSAQAAAVHPACIVSPTSSADVSKAVKTLTRLDCDFAIRAGYDQRQR